MLAQVAGGRRHAGAGGDLDAVVEERHLGAGDRAEQRELVQVTDMADAEHLARDLGQAGAEGEVVAHEGVLDDLGGVEALRHQDGGDGVRVPARVLGAGLQTPGRDGLAGGLAEHRVAVIDVLQAFLEQAGERLAQAVEQRQRRGVGEVAGAVLLLVVFPVEVDAGEPVVAARGALGGLERLLADANHAEAGGEHQALLGAGDGAVDLPLVGVERQRADRGHAIDEEQGRVAGGVDRLAHGADVGGHAGRGLVMDHHDGLDLVVLVGAQGLLDLLGMRAGAPLLLLDDDVEAEALRHVDPEVAELAVAGGQDLVAAGEGVGQRGFPDARAGGGEQEDRALGGAEHLLGVLEERLRQRREVDGAVILGLHQHRAHDAVRDVGRAGHEQMVAPRPSRCRHGVSSELPE